MVSLISTLLVIGVEEQCECSLGYDLPDFGRNFVYAIKQNPFLLLVFTQLPSVCIIMSNLQSPLDSARPKRERKWLIDQITTLTAARPTKT